MLHQACQESNATTSAELPAAAVTVPVCRAVQDGTPGAAPAYRGTRDAIRSIVRQEGWRGLYSGLAPALLGSGATCCIMLSQERPSICEAGEGGGGFIHFSSSAIEVLQVLHAPKITPNHKAQPERRLCSRLKVHGGDCALQTRCCASLSVEQDWELMPTDQGTTSQAEIGKPYKAHTFLHADRLALFANCLAAGMRSNHHLTWSPSCCIYLQLFQADLVRRRCVPSL